MPSHRSRSTPGAARRHRSGGRAARSDPARVNGSVQDNERRATRAHRDSTSTLSGRQQERSVLPLYTPAAAAQLLAVRESWLRRRAAARAVPCTYLGKHLRFSRADLEAIVQAAAQPARTRTRPATSRAQEPLVNAGPAHDNDDHDELTAPGTPGRASRSQLGVARRRGPNKASRRAGVAPAGEDAQGRAA